MKICLISDIHGNSDSLRAVLKSAKLNNVEKILCCGDYIGYYYEPDKVIEMLNNWNWVGVSGNHERMFLDWEKNIRRNEIKRKYGSGIEFAFEKLYKPSIIDLCKLPKLKKLTVDGYKVIICHSCPWGDDIYVYPDADVSTVDKMFNYDPSFDLMVYGQTHHPVIWKRDNKIIINPGSVGQPRDRIPGACWVLWDTSNNEFQFFREKYDPTQVIEMCKKHDPDLSYLVDVLIRE